MNYSIVPPHLAVKAMRDNGYKNAAYAIAELIDNSIQAGADKVELLCGEIDVNTGSRLRSRINKIGVLDNGFGMNAELLRMALQFGNGEHLKSDQQKGIGKFGMGLPASSISQCKRVDVWSWKKGIDSALYTFLDLDDIAAQRMAEVPDPVPSNVPDKWIDAASEIGESGTLVIWSNLDKLIWKTARAIINNSEFVVGRMYRKFLESDRVVIRMAGFNLDNPSDISLEILARPNDPGYLMSHTSCPEPFRSKQMFDRWGGEDYEIEHVIRFRDRDHTVRMRFSVAKEDARQGVNPGAKPHGKHAARNVGVSIVRADRELELDTTWTTPSDPRERWWGVELDFPPGLDELFGVTNNKQHAHNFSELAKLDIDELLKGGITMTQLKEEFEADEDPRGPLLDIVNQIKKTLNVLRKLLRAQTKSQEHAENRRHRDVRNTPEARATEITNKRKNDGYIGESDNDEDLLSPDERKGILEQSLIDDGLPDDVAKGLAASTVSNGLKYVFAEADLETPAFFSVKQRGGSIVITLNINHPAYHSLVEILESTVEDESDVQVDQRLSNALDGLKLLLMAWARYEDEQPDGSRRIQAQETRVDWGRLARQFLLQDE